MDVGHRTPTRLKPKRQAGGLQVAFLFVGEFGAVTANTKVHKRTLNPAEVEEYRGVTWHQGDTASEI